MKINKYNQGGRTAMYDMLRKYLLGGRLNATKVTPATKKKIRLKKRAERKGIDTAGMQADETGGRFVTQTTRNAEGDDRTREVYNPIKKDRLENRALDRVRKTGRRFLDDPQATGSASSKSVSGEASPDATKGQIRRADRTVDQYNKELAKQGRDRTRTYKPGRGRKYRNE
jgi:hypothetical protein